MKTKFELKKTWISSLEIMRKNPIVMLPFIFIGFLECLSLELIFFSTRRPISYITIPIYMKFLGPGATRYPGNLVHLPKLFYYAQLAIYVLFGVLMTAVCVNMVRNIRQGLPPRPRASYNNSFKRYMGLLFFAVVLIVLSDLVKRADMFAFAKIMQMLSARITRAWANFSFLILAFVLFITNIILQTFLILTIPIAIIKEKSIMKALGISIVTGAKNFFKIFAMLLLPMLLYLPIMALKSVSLKIVDKVFPEINLIVVAIGILIVIFMDSFITVCAAQFIIDREEAKGA